MFYYQNIASIPMATIFKSLDLIKPYELNEKPFITNFQKKELWLYEEVSKRLGEDMCLICDTAYDSGGCILPDHLAFFSEVGHDIVFKTTNQIQKDKCLNNPLLIFDPDLYYDIFPCLISFSGSEVEYILEFLSGGCALSKEILKSIRRNMSRDRVLISRNNMYSFNKISNHEWKIEILK